MNYLATQIDQKPYIIFQSTDLPVGGLVVAQEDVPANVHGICPKKIVAGELVDRDEPEMESAEAQFNSIKAIDGQSARGLAMERKTFSFDARNFPLTAHAQMYYRAIAHATTDKNVMDANGATYVLAAAEIEAFIEAFDTKVINELQPTI